MVTNTRYDNDELTGTGYNGYLSTTGYTRPNFRFNDTSCSSYSTGTYTSYPTKKMIKEIEKQLNISHQISTWFVPDKVMAKKIPVIVKPDIKIRNNLPRKIRID